MNVLRKIYHGFMLRLRKRQVKVLSHRVNDSIKQLRFYQTKLNEEHNNQRVDQ